MGLSQSNKHSPYSLCSLRKKFSLINRYNKRKRINEGVIGIQESDEKEKDGANLL